MFPSALSGRLTADARYFEGKTGKVARFSIAHNFAHGQQPLFVDCVMFSKTGAKDTPIPENLLSSQAPVPGRLSLFPLYQPLILFDMASNIYQMVTDRIIEQMNAGIVPWHQPWVGDQLHYSQSLLHA